MEHDEPINSDIINSTNSSQTNQLAAADSSIVNQSANSVISDNQLQKAATDTSEQHPEQLIIGPYSDGSNEDTANSRGNENSWRISEEIPTEVLIRNEYNKFCSSLLEPTAQVNRSTNMEEDINNSSLNEPNNTTGSSHEKSVDEDLQQSSSSRNESLDIRNVNASTDHQEENGPFMNNDRSRNSQDQEWSPAQDSDIRQDDNERIGAIEDRQELDNLGDGDCIPDRVEEEPSEDEGEEEDDDEEEEDDIFTDYIDSETDYENDHIIQYQAAIAAGLIDDERQCWVCFASDEDDPVAVWVHPCRCSGTTKWVHLVCLQRWVDEKQKGNNVANVSCPNCGTEYVIRFPPSGPIMKILDSVDLMIGRMCPLIFGGILVGGTYWLFVTYGAVTVMQVAGHDEGWRLMEAAEPILLLVSLPLIPCGLFLGKMVKWQDPVLKVLRKYLPQFPLTRYILPAFAEVPARDGSGAAAHLPPSSDHVSIPRTFCGALIFPTVATLVGSVLYSNTESGLKRAVLGGLTFVLVKGVLKVYHKQHQYIRQSRRVIDNYDPNNANNSNNTNINSSSNMNLFNSD
eukprot:TRINITY_DN3121_c0_g1_i2.p1 TRINITY_DN3121_c0_g1~~TRINITY_DN3121_c0_g1_i2.p1  ORF type:complete len:571 (+),score=117.69 TRINITY_DN3121_c0_g1_i2:574-2286(+)